MKGAYHMYFNVSGRHLHRGRGHAAEVLAVKFRDFINEVLGFTRGILGVHFQFPQQQFADCRFKWIFFLFLIEDFPDPVGDILTMHETFGDDQI